jgi:hypothetical protein
MKMPGFTAEATFQSASQTYEMVLASLASTGTDEVVPQLCACTPCVGVGGGRWCVTIPVINKRVCVNVPNFGRWKVCGCLRFGWPPVSFGLQHC